MRCEHWIHWPGWGDQLASLPIESTGCVYSDGDTVMSLRLCASPVFPRVETQRIHRDTPRIAHIGPGMKTIAHAHRLANSAYA